MTTQAVIDTLLDAEKITPEQRDYVNVLGILVQEYEERHVPIPDLRGVELLKGLIDEFNLKQKDLVPIFKTESIVSAVLNGQRRFTVGHIEKLAEFFHVPPSVFFDACWGVIADVNHPTKSCVGKHNGSTSSAGG